MPRRWSPWTWMILPSSSSSTMLPLHANSFLKALSRRTKLSPSFRPWTVVSVLRPFRCWMRMWTYSNVLSCAVSPVSSTVSAKGSNVLRFSMLIKAVVLSWWSWKETSG
eukprot:Amastigsp_a174925_7200.p3 type:complete len:109 gc:universal Amastigsp_a174925_7200:199-525(+)